MKSKKEIRQAKIWIIITCLFVIILATSCFIIIKLTHLEPLLIIGIHLSLALLIFFGLLFWAEIERKLEKRNEKAKHQQK